MKESLKENYLPTTHKDHLMGDFSMDCQGSLFVHEYMNKFNDLIVCCDVQNEPCLTLPRFRSRLRLDVRCEMLPHTLTYNEQAY